MSRMTKNERMVWAAAFVKALLEDDRAEGRHAAEMAFCAVDVLRDVAAELREREEGMDVELCCRQMVEE